MLKITKKAYKYILNLCNLNKIFNLKIFIIYKNLNYKLKIYFYNENEINKDDLLINFKDFNLYIDFNSINYLNKSKIDIIENDFEKKLILNMNFNIINKKNNLLINKIIFFVNKNINSLLKIHNGKIEILEINEKNDLIIKFLGSCNGCNLIDITLKNIIEKKIIKKFPEIQNIIDITNHKHGSHSYI